LKKTRIIFFAGKGGVGKTTAASATAVQAASQGYRTLILSTDPAHSLSDIFDIRFSGETIAINENLDFYEIDPYHELNANWGHIRDYLSSLMISLGADESLSGELATIPGMDNLFSLLRIREFHYCQKYDVIIIDMAPTGESLRLLSLPQAISLALKITRYLEKYLVSPVIRPASRMSKSLRAVVAPQEVTKSWEAILQKLLDIRKILEHDTVASTRLILTPEKMVINESQRALTYLNLFGMTVDMVVANRIIPSSAENGYFGDWVKTQTKYLDRIEKLFSPIPIRTVPFLKNEISTLADLKSFSEILYGDQDATKLFYAERPVKLKRSKNESVFSIQLPFMKPDTIELTRRGSELFVQIDRQIRSYIIPDSLSGFSPSSADYVDGWIQITFKKDRVSKS